MSLRSIFARTATVAMAAAALAAPTASARPADTPPGHSSSLAVTATSVGVQHRYLGSDATASSPRESVPAPVAHAARDGFDWTDVGIGAGLAAALLLSAAGISASRRQPQMRVRS